MGPAAGAGAVGPRQRSAMEVQVAGARDLGVGIAVATLRVAPGVVVGLLHPPLHQLQSLFPLRMMHMMQRMHLCLALRTGRLRPFRQLAPHQLQLQHLPPEAGVLPQLLAQEGSP